MRVLVLDNGDPSLDALLGPLRELEAECDVRPSSSLQLKDIQEMNPQPRRILFTSGPGTPESTGVCTQVVLKLGGDIPIVGIGLGMHVILHVAQGELVPPRSSRGGTATIRHDGKNLFAGLPSPFNAPHDPCTSLVMDGRKIPHDLEVSAWSEDGTALGCRVWALSTEGIQVDSRWFATQLGGDMLFNFLYQAQAW